MNAQVDLIAFHASEVGIMLTMVFQSLHYSKRNITDSVYIHIFKIPCYYMPFRSSNKSTENKNLSQGLVTGNRKGKHLKDNSYN